MKQATLIFAALLTSSSLMAQTYVTVSGDYFRATSDEVQDADFDGWGAGIDLTHWFDNEVYVNVSGGIQNAGISECIEGFCVKADTDVIGTSVALGKRFENFTPFVKTSFVKVDTTYSVLNQSFTDDETDWDVGFGGLLESGDMLFGITVDGLRDTDDGFTVTGQAIYKVTSTDGISINIGRLFNVDDLESTRFGIGWVRFL
ncbi:MAG: hypothetical protein OXG15_03125 [Gammaproteobacteria bacterium]|nr:hypothetical protein [Gammaproteobacteria bacterium]